jgi:hypothetical protein
MPWSSTLSAEGEMMKSKVHFSTLIFAVSCTLILLGCQTLVPRGDVLTTRLDHAYSEFPLLDDWDPIFPSGSRPPQRADGALVLRPGVFEFAVQSYCLDLAKGVPHRGGPGYLPAPLKGPHADIIRNILRNSAKHPHIAQSKIQTLLWAIGSRTKVSDLSADMQQVARALLRSDEILRLNFDARDWMGVLTGNLPFEFRQALQPMMQVHQLLRHGRETFEQLERLAVRLGPPPSGANGHSVPYGRWSYHPKGFFIRYLPDSYSRTRLQVSVPERFSVQRDELRRILSVADTQGNRIETVYDDSIAPLVVPEDPRLRGYAFRSIRFIRPKPSEPHQFEQVEWRDVGWTFVGARKATVADWNQGINGRTPRVLLASLKDEGVGGAPQRTQALPRYEDGLRRYHKYRGYYNEYKWLKDRWNRAHSTPGPEAADEVLDLTHYREGLKVAITGSPRAKYKWLIEHFERVARAFQYFTAVIEGLPNPEGLASPNIPEVVYNPSEDTGVPGDSSFQRLGWSTRSP